MDWQSIGLLSKAPKKKYIKKILEYAAALELHVKATPSELHTPISQQLPHDLELSSTDAHGLSLALARLIREARRRSFEEERIRQMIGKHVDPQLSDVLVQLLSKMGQTINKNSLEFVTQGEKLIDFDWKLGNEVATEKGKCSIPIVDIGLTTAKDSRIKNTNLELKGSEFNVFFKNLQKIKQHLSQLANTSQ